MSASPSFEYHVLEMLGRGGMGTVYRAEMRGPESFSKIVAVKILNAEVQGNPDLVQRLRDEARMLALVRHRAIVQVDRLLPLEDGWAIVMEYVAGLDTAEVLLRYGPIPLSPALEIVAEVAGALHVAYNSPPEGSSGDRQPLRLVHRDIKPANVRMTPSGGVKLLDFGVAQAQFPAREAHTDSLRYGSTRYMSPQRLCWEDDGHYGDLYALGAVLYELLLGRALGLASDRPELHAQIVDRACGALRDASIPEEVVALVADCLSFDLLHRPDARVFVQRARRAAEGQWPSLTEWAETLDLFETPYRMGGGTELSGHVLREQVVSAGTPANLTLEWPDPAPVVDDRSLRMHEPPLRRRRPIGWIAMTAAALAAAGVLAVRLLTADPPSAEVVEVTPPRTLVPCTEHVGDRDGRALIGAVDALFRGWQQLDAEVVGEALSPDFVRRDHVTGDAQDRTAYLDARRQIFSRLAAVTWTGPLRDAAGFGVPAIEGEIAVRCRPNGHLRVVVRYDWTVTSKAGSEKPEHAVVDAYELDDDGLIVENIDYADLGMALSWRDGCCL